jgi:hypothetical protein
MLQIGRSRVRDPDDVNDFFNYLILPGALGAGVYCTLL